MTTTTALTTIDTVTLDVPDVASAAQFYAAAFGALPQLRLRQTTDAAGPSTGFRGYTLSLIVAQPSTVDSLVDSAVAAGATLVKPAQKSLWGHGGVVQAPDGAIWQVATSSKKDTGPATRQIDEVVLLLAADDVKASKRFYVDRGLAVGKSFGAYTEFDLPSSPVKLGLYSRKALAKAAGVPPEGSGSHRIAIGGGGIAGDAGFTDPDGFEWVSSAA